MKKSELKQIIKEEIQIILKEFNPNNLLNISQDYRGSKFPNIKTKKFEGTFSVVLMSALNDLIKDFPDYDPMKTMFYDDHVIINYKGKSKKYSMKNDSYSAAKIRDKIVKPALLKM